MTPPDPGRRPPTWFVAFSVVAAAFWLTLAARAWSGDGGGPASTPLAVAAVVVSVGYVALAVVMVRRRR